ncbi:MAG: hypothetical protein M3Y72_19920 [Acidobacteriota bacterium]|nr:hypothetical protein [Acidobacteriota bacterium]
MISVSGSQHIKLHDVAVEADANEVGILVDGTGKLIGPILSPDNPNDPTRSRISLREYVVPRVVDVTIKDLFLTGSTLPAILAKRVEMLRIDDNRVLMEDVRSLWPSIYVSGIEMHLHRNYVGIQGLATMLEWLPTTVAGDLIPFTDSNSDIAVKTQAPTSAKTQAATKKAAKKAPAKSAITGLANVGRLLPIEGINVTGIKIKVATHMGGIMIAGLSREVFVCENLIEGGRFNGITLGNYSVVDGKGLETGSTIGVTTVHEDPCSTTGTLEPPSSSTTGTHGTEIVAGGLLIDITIDRNRIGNIGFCGIGPVGLFDLRRIFEIISIENLTTTNNTIRNTVLRSTAALNTFGSLDSQETYNASSLSGQDAAGNYTGTNTQEGSFGAARPITSGASSPYAAICVPAVENLVIRDDVIANFGAKPGVGANGIFVLNG